MSTLPPELLERLRCPETAQPLHEAGAAELARFNAEIARGALVSHGGKKLAAPLAAALITRDGARLYPVLDGIPVLLIEEAVRAAPGTFSAGR
jgi:uncharacterized protein YbaR (Trm112 family)